MDQRKDSLEALVICGKGVPNPPLFTIVMEFFSVMMTAYDSSSLIHSPFKRPWISISHLMFTDYLIVFSAATTSVAYQLRNL